MNPVEQVAEFPLENEIVIGSEPGDHIEVQESSFITVKPSLQNHRQILDTYLNEMNNLTMKHKDKDKMFSLCGKIVQQIGLLNREMLEQEDGMAPVTVIEAATTFFSGEIESFTSRYKREKKIAKNPLYVAPQERAIGTRIELIFDKEKQIEKPQLIQSTFQTVSIIGSLKAFFSRPENMGMYFKFQRDNRCEPNIYKSFCCGDVFKSEEFFRLNPEALQLQIAFDDVEICDPLSSKSNMHKISAVYLVIRNIPHWLNSKLNNIFLVCLCNVDDIKTKKTDVNNIWELIVDELKFLEETGIELCDGTVLKGTLVSIAADNLAANLALCMTESFRAHYFCRICTLNSDECQEKFAEDLEKYRNSAQYEEMLEIISNSETVDFKETYGIKRNCVLNNLNYFDIFKNFSLDIMHDLNEGIVGFLLKDVFLHLEKNKVIKEDDLKSTIKFYQYPKCFRRDKPSILNLKKHNLGQNAAQMKCLFLNIPFILMKYENNIHLQQVWSCVKWLIRIFQIVYSDEIDENLLKELDECVSNHLKSYRQIFNARLRPKHHFLIHYTNIIRMMGPLVHMSMIRYDAKHTFFKQVVRNTNNFININKTLAIKHQQCLATKENTFCDKITHSKEKRINTEFLKANFDNSIVSQILNSSSFSEVDTFLFNSYKYERGSIITCQGKLYEIEMLLFIKSDYFFVGKEMENLGIHEFTQSLQVKEILPIHFSLIKHSELSHKKPYCCKFIGVGQFIIIDNRDILRSLF